ncbi:MAG: hypothetical protein HQ589_08395 [Syntrophaceae bacterium]|nr:hypothetical protein [Syntrophaceae bacterium]
MNFSRKLQILPALIFAGILMFSFYPTEAPACEIDVTVHGESGEIYRTGDEVVLKVKVFLTHRNCPEGIDATEFKAEGMDVLGATKWTETSGSHFERLVKVKITASESSKSIFYAKRTCSKEGGYNYLELNVGAV